MLTIEQDNEAEETTGDPAPTCGACGERDATEGNYCKPCKDECFACGGVGKVMVYQNPYTGDEVLARCAECQPCRGDDR